VSSNSADGSDVLLPKKGYYCDSTCTWLGGCNWHARYIVTKLRINRCLKGPEQFGNTQ
jgi:hypothetical protein